MISGLLWGHLGGTPTTTLSYLLPAVPVTEDYYINVNVCRALPQERYQLSGGILACFCGVAFSAELTSMPAGARPEPAAIPLCAWVGRVQDNGSVQDGA